ncbi:MAG TPA: lipopolysaccharide biosynthesis protein [Stellaceae bacterium]|nr:lipopolysaccharide biosynthesis protein [Stellaceae bacterium]
MRSNVEAGKRDGGEEPASLAAKTAKGAGWTVGWRFVTRNLGLISTLALVRLLAPADFGLVALATGFIGMIDALSALGPQEAVVREPAPDRAMYDTAFTMNCLRNIGTAAIVAGTAWPVAAFFSEPRLTPVLLALSAGTFVTAFENIGIVDFQRELAFHKEFQLRVSARVVGVTLTILFAVLWRNYWAIIIGILSTTVVRIVQSYTMSPYRPRLALRKWRQIVGFSLWVWGSGLVLMIWDKIDSVVIGRFLGATAVGVFAVGWEIGSLPLTELVLPLNRALFSGFSEANRTGRGAAQLYLRVLAMTVVLTLPAGVGISLVADPLVRLMLGEQWLSAVPLVQILGLAGAMFAPAYVAEALFKAEGRPHLNFHVGVVATCVKVPLFVALVSAFGLKGGAIAATLAIAVQQICYLAIISRQIGSGVGELLRETWRSLVATAVMAGILAALGLGWEHGTTGAIGAAHSFFIACPVGALFYAAALLGIWLIQGRPEGAESDMLRLVGLWCRPALLARLARPPADLG